VSQKYNHLERLHAILSAVCPIHGCDATTFHPLENATSQQVADAKGAFSTFDWSDAAHEDWLANRNPDRKALAGAAQQALADNATFLALGSATNAQIAAQVRALTRQNNQLIRRLVQL